MKILFAAVTGYGHVNPLLPLADALARSGNDVTFATGADMRHHLARAGHRWLPGGMTSDEQRAAIAEVRPPKLSVHETVAFAYDVLFPRLHAPRMLPDLLRAVDTVQPDLLICGDTAELATPLVGTLRGVPWVQHSYGVLRPAYAWQLATAAIEPLWTAHGLPVPARAGMFSGAYLDVCPPSLQTPEIGSVPERLPMRAAGAPGPVPDPSQAGRRHVLVSFGAVFDGDLSPLARALSRLPIEFMVTAGRAAGLDTFPARARLVAYVPLTELLPGCSAVVTHGGSGTVLAALAHGLPLVILPQGADHLLNAERVSAAGAGVCAASVDAVPAALTRVLDDPRFAQRARGLATEIARMPSTAAVAADLVGRQLGQCR